MGYTFSANYNPNGDPSAISILLTFQQLIPLLTVSNSATEAKFDYSLKEGDKLLSGMAHMERVLSLPMP